MGFDAKAFKQFQKDFGELEREYHKFLSQFLLQEALRSLAKTKKRTPVDYGNLRNAWRVTKVMRKGDSLYVVIFNPLEYASFIEDGHRQEKRFLPGKVDGKGKFRYIKGYKDGGIMLSNKWVKGYHMARLSVSEVQRDMPPRYRAAFSSWLKRQKVYG